MAKPILEARVIQKVGTAQEWSDNDFVLMDGEMGFERTSSGLPVNFKVGDNDKPYSELPYFHPYIINGSISTTQTIAELNALENGVYSAKGAGTYANGLVANEGQYTTFRKTEDGWSLDARVDVTWESPDLEPIEDELADHEQRITAEENKSETFTNQISQHSNRIRDLQNTISNFKDYNVWLNNSYETLGNPRTQEAYNTRMLNYVINGLSNSSNFKTNTYNNVTENFDFGTLEWRFNQIGGIPYFTSNGYTTRFGSKLSHESDEDNIGELDKTGIGGKLESVNWKIQKLSGQTQASNINLPITGSVFRTAIISVNGEYADENGNIVVSGGGGGYILPPASAGTLGGIKVGSGLSITPDGVLSATGGGGGGGYVLPTASFTTKGGVKVDNKTTQMNGEFIEALLPKRETLRIALSAFNTDLMSGDLNGLVAVRPFKIIDFKTTASVVPTGSAITTGIKKNGSVITSTLSTINANTNNSVATTQPTFSSDTFAIGDRLNFYIPSGGVGSTTTGQNLQAILIIEYTD